MDKDKQRQYEQQHRTTPPNALLSWERERVIFRRYPRSERILCPLVRTKSGCSKLHKGVGLCGGGASLLGSGCVSRSMQVVCFLLLLGKIKEREFAGWQDHVRVDR